MEALKAGTPQGRTDNMSPESSEVYGRQTQVVLATSDLDEARCPAEAGTTSHGAKHTHTWLRSGRSREGIPGKVGWSQAWWLTRADNVTGEPAAPW